MGARQIVIARAFTIIVGMLLCAGRVLAATSDFDEANRLYEQGKFLEAARAYESIAASGAATAHVWFNLGNANYKAGHIGRAIAAYRMAERLTPRDTALRANLQFVRGRVYSDDRAHVPRWRTMVRYLTLNEWTIVTATAIWALFAVLACGEFTGRRYAKTAVVIGIIALCCGAGTALTWNDLQQAQAVVVAREATVRRGPLDDSPSVFQLRDGAELNVLGTKGDWLEVLDAEKRRGWIRRDELAVLR